MFRLLTVIFCVFLSAGPMEVREIAFENTKAHDITNFFENLTCVKNKLVKVTYSFPATATIAGDKEHLDVIVVLIRKAEIKHRISNRGF